jgi:hypothetical protein
LWDLGLGGDGSPPNLFCKVKTNSCAMDRTRDFFQALNLQSSAIIIIKPAADQPAAKEQMKSQNQLLLFDIFIFTSYVKSLNCMLNGTLSAILLPLPSNNLPKVQEIAAEIKANPRKDHSNILQLLYGNLIRSFLGHASLLMSQVNVLIPADSRFDQDSFFDDLNLKYQLLYHRASIRHFLSQSLARYLIRVDELQRKRGNRKTKRIYEKETRFTRNEEHKRWCDQRRVPSSNLAPIARQD